MAESKEYRLPELTDFEPKERTPAVELLLKLCYRQAEEIQRLNEVVAMQAEQIALLKDEIAVLKGEKKRPKIKPSLLNRGGKQWDEGSCSNKKHRGKPCRKKTYKLKIDYTKVIFPEKIPEGSKPVGYEEYVVQDIEIQAKNTKYIRIRYQTLTGEYVIGELPASVAGTHFGPGLRSYILKQYYQQHVSENLIHKELLEYGIEISSGQISRILVENHEPFHNEKEEILRTGLEVSSYVGVDDTGARHQGRNGFCTRIGNELFTWFSSTGSKSRQNFLELLRAGHGDYVIDDVAREYMREQRLANGQIALFSEDMTFADRDAWEAHLAALGPLCNKRHQRIITEAALVASALSHGMNPALVIMSDDAGQFNIAGFLNTLCWVHAERTINKIIAYNDTNRIAQELVRDQIWNFYQSLKAYKLAPTDAKKAELIVEFDKIFTKHTCFQTLNLALQRIYDNKVELLRVLSRPEIPLHNNLSENDIRDYVKRRNISATTRSDSGQAARDTFLSLKKTCQKLGISFWNYLQDRLSRQYLIPPLPELIRAAAEAP